MQFLKKKASASNSSDAGQPRGEKASLKRAKSLSETKNWYQARYQVVAIQRNVFFLICVIMMVCLLIATMAVSSLTGVRTFEPFLIKVEDKTGAITTVDQHSVQRYSSDEVIIEHFIRKYLRAREEFNTAEVGHTRKVINLLSSGLVHKQYLASPEIREPDNNSYKTIVIKSITSVPGTNNQKRISFKTLTYDMRKLNYAPKEAHYLVTLAYNFHAVKLSPADLEINPLGFKIEHYNRVREAT